ncbi:Rv3654c family TadE-like protein [Knoellia sp. Soil729]|uniref:Rv3654c family TadE-like protein n=1 Tax=Knoellia sp. Soil729 TaxID=1736394 RepID=UPI0006FD3631|nr:Rv3654c family TadE-like protein [Knoellia sp. Soil729]KRE42427.1 hypothetical protein ASG74_08340 [Knoellia sp. Soil729]
MTRWAPERSPEQGSGTVLVVAAIGVLLVLATAGFQLGAAATAAHRARAAADLSALAGATARQGGGGGGVPCALVADVAARNGADVIACSLGVGESVTVRVSVEVSTHWPGVPDRAVASARAGPGDAQSSNEPPSSAP